ncbi:MAG TPA: glycosyltransferase [Noviherbaspirillum sp.]|uniref:glycosyltransferase n=1 Tax=Noviherbaspirillum sp. TaxID=1926288 RepID=UPI002B489F00|nr:glycosyltransferase [Noviherbaspirillum sp.]HJV84330.1 glycosyltransferase [Noviherbaspirillum sp.]
MRKIRVLFHVTHLRRGGGIETSLMSWLRILDRDRFAVGLSIAYPTEDMESVYRERIPEDVALHILGPEAWLSHCRNLKIKGQLRWPGRLYEEVLLPQLRKRVFRDRIGGIADNYDVVIDYDMSLARFAHGFGKPLIGISHFSLSQRLSASKRKYRTASRYFQRYDAIVAICDAMRDEGRQMFPALAERFTTLYPGFDLVETHRRANEPANDIPDAPYIVSVTRLEETQKDVTTLIKAFASLVKRHRIDESMLIVGEGRHRAELETLCDELGVRDRVRFFGFTTNPLPYVRGARLKVLSSKFEGLPTALIEGLIVGQVLVSSDCPTGPREILNHGKAGLLAPVGDADALAEAILRGLRDGELRDALSTQAAMHAQTFGVNAFGERFEMLVQRMFEKAA